MSPATSKISRDRFQESSQKFLKLFWKVAVHIQTSIYHSDSQCIFTNDDNIASETIVETYRARFFFYSSSYKMSPDCKIS